MTIDAADSSSFAATNVGEPQVDSLFDQNSSEFAADNNNNNNLVVTGNSDAGSEDSYASNTELVQNAVLADSNPGSEIGFDMTETTDDDDDDNSNNGYASIPPFFS